MIDVRTIFLLIDVRTIYLLIDGRTNDRSIYGRRVLICSLDEGISDLSTDREMNDLSTETGPLPVSGFEGVAEEDLLITTDSASKPVAHSSFARTSRRSGQNRGRRKRTDGRKEGRRGNAQTCTDFPGRKSKLERALHNCRLPSNADTMALDDGSGDSGRADVTDPLVWINAPVRTSAEAYL